MREMDKVSGHCTSSRPAKDKREAFQRQTSVHSSVVTPDCKAVLLRTNNRTDRESLTESESEELRRAIQVEEKFIDFVMSLPAMSPENVESCKRKQLMRSSSEYAAPSTPESGMEHLDNLYKLMEHLGQLKRQNTKLQQRVQYLENISGEQEEIVQETCDGSADTNRRQSRNKRSAKCKSSHYGPRQTVVRSTRVRSRSVGVEDMMKDMSRPLVGAKSKVSKWTKVKEAFKWEKASSGVLPEAKSQDSGLGVGEDRYLRVPHSASDPPSSSFSVSPADSVLSGQSCSRRSVQYEGGTHISSTSSSEDDLELESNDDKAQGVVWSAEEATRRSKSLDGDMTITPGSIFEFHLTSKSGHQLQKTHRTAWSKMKDIIQTRTGSIKRRKAGESVSDVEEEKSTPEHSATCNNEEESCPVIACKIVGTADAATERPTEGVNRRRLAPVLTITLPSTEELRTVAETSRVLLEPQQKMAENPAMSSKPPPSPQAEVKTSGAGHQHEDTYKRQVGLNSAGASPPSTRRTSNWCKVKSAFLTSSADHNKEPMGRISSSVPSSPVKAVNFLYDLESEDLSSGEFVEVLHDDVFREEEGGTTQSEIQRNFEELQLKLSHEFHRKLAEWDKIKCSGSNAGTPTIGKVGSSGVSSGMSSVSDDSPHDKEFKRKMDEWEKMKVPAGKQRELAALQQLGEEALSPDFKKKLEEWQKIKSVPLLPTPESTCVVQPQFKKKITEWQRWRPGSGSHMTSDQEFNRRVQEWARLKASDSPDIDKTSSPKFYRCGDHSGEQKVVKKGHRVGETNKWSEYSLAHGKILHKGKTHEVKELAWLEKELHKIEREKSRLEREREKFLEREARLEKMRRAIGSGATKQEVLIPTSAGLFRFQGISQKFTRKLYEWEKAKGIGPEASTFALLDPGYQPPQILQHIGNSDTANGKVLTRSKSVGSVADITVSSQVTHQPSSLSLNDMESLEETHLAVASHLQGSTEGELGSCQLLLEYDDEPGAMIVDIEDVIEETASPLVEEPALSETPVYCYAPAEITRLIDSSGSDSDRDQINVEGREAVQTSYHLLQENMSLLDKLKMKDVICRNLENEMENLESKIHDIAQSHKEQLGQLELPADDKRKMGGTGEAERLVTIRARISELEKHRDHLRQEGETLQHYFLEQSGQQAALAQNLVGKLKLLQDVQISISEQPAAIEPTDQGLNTKQDEAMAMVQDLTMQLLNMAEKLESAVGERNNEICSLRAALREKKTVRKLHSGQHWFSTDSMSSLHNHDAETKFVFRRQSSDELSQLPSLLTNKILQLKRGLSYLCAASDTPRDPASGSHDMPLELSSESFISNASEAKEEIASSFVLQIGNRRARPSLAAITPLDDSQVKHRECYTGSEQEDGNTTPVTSFTFTPAFLRKRNTDLSVRNDEVEENHNTAGHLVKGGNVDSKQELISQSVECDNAEMVGSERTVTSRLVNAKDIVYCERLRFEEDSGEVYRSVEDNCRSFNKTERVITEPRACVESNSSIVVQKGRNENRKLVNLLKTRRITDTHVDYDHSGDEEELVVVRSRPFSITQARTSQYDSNTVELDDISSVKESAVISPLLYETECITQVVSGDISDSVNEDLANRSNTPINVFVPTTRTIFSPAQRDGKGKARSVVSYVIDDENKNTENSQNKLVVESLIEEEANVCSTVEDSNIEKNTLEPSIEKEKEERPTSFIFPPCWILQETRAQSASPALQRRYMRHTKTKEIMTGERTPKPINSKNTNSIISNDCCTDPNKFKEPDLKLDYLPKKIIHCGMSQESKKVHSSSDNYEIKSTSNTASPSANSMSSDREATCFRNNSEKKLMGTEISKKDSSSSESSIDHFRSDKKDILSFRRTETGFPPISPLARKRDFSASPKETAPSIRMMIARYNQKVTEQDISGTKSPESGSGSPVAWRSPVAERRVRAQMERYQEEVRRVLENSNSREVQKSASAGFIRPSVVGPESQTSNSKVEVQIPSRGILKSSSAGTIKPMSPLVSRSEKITAIKIDESANKIISILPPVLEPFSLDERISKVTNVMDQMQMSDSVLAKNPDKTRALKLQLAKEEFLSRGQRQESLTTDSCNGQNMRSDVRLNRLSQISCESDSSYDGSSILVRGQEQYSDCDGVLLVKSASASMINMDSSTADDSIPHSRSNSSVPSTSSSVTPKTSRFGLSNLASKFRKVRMRRNKGKSESNANGKMDTVSSLCRQSLVVDIDRHGSRDGGPTTSKSCPSSPVLNRQKRDTSCWIRNPAKKIFKPK